MLKYFVWDISNIFEVFSSITCNKDFDLSMNDSGLINDFAMFSIDDLILGVKNNSEVFVNLKVCNIMENKINLVKIFETSHTVKLYDYGIVLKKGGIKEIKKTEYDKIIKDITMLLSNKENLNLNDFKLPHNRIIFGAPGTGKSFKLETESKVFDEIERVTFHPNYSFSHFVGTYKPIMKKFSENISDEIKHTIEIVTDKNKTSQEKYDILYDLFKDNNSLTRLPILLGIYSDEEFNTKKQDGSITNNKVEKNHGSSIREYVTFKSANEENEIISYAYIPGPFMRVYVNAKKYPNKIFLLLIEEINRANAAAVFGDIFQLLDRKEDGSSHYPIAASEDQKAYLESQGIYEDKISIPSNMYIWATMNSADQGVQPMDAAFKRRWEFEYLDINNEEAVEKIKDYKIPIKKDGSKYVFWKDFRSNLNDKLSEIKINEDKLLGPFFLSDKTLKNAMDNPEEFINLFKSKVIMYLLEDVVKMQPTKLFKVSTIRYSKICEEFDEKGMDIFGLDKVEVFDNDLKEPMNAEEGENKTDEASDNA